MTVPHFVPLAAAHDVLVGPPPRRRRVWDLVVGHEPGRKIEHTGRALRQRFQATLHEMAFDMLAQKRGHDVGGVRQPTRPFAALRRSPDSRLQSGYALLSSRIRRHFLILIDVLFSSYSPRSSGGRAPLTIYSAAMRSQVI